MKKQPNSQMCFVCGLENPIGLKLAFYEDREGQVFALFTPEDQHEGYPGILHGGIITALLDEILGRVAIARQHWVMTVRLNVRFRFPTPTNQTLLVAGEALGWKKNLFEARGKIILSDGRVCAEATGTFIEVSLEDMEDASQALTWWQVVPDDEPPDFDPWSEHLGAS
jgi:acyl-coenzyme A thioesterase PaaI-like protein